MGKIVKYYYGRRYAELTENKRFATMNEAYQWIEKAQKTITGFKVISIEDDIVIPNMSLRQVVSFGMGRGNKQDGSTDACILGMDY